MYGLMILALRPEIQDKVIEEIDQIFQQAAGQGRAELSYDDDFEKLVYTYGFMVRSPMALSSCATLLTCSVRVFPTFSWRYPHHESCATAATNHVE